jgi:integrase
LFLVNAAVDVRRTRRELTADELRRLFDAARASERRFRGLAGVDRYFLYLLAVVTGFRASAQTNLTPENIDLDAMTVTLPARFNKSRRLKVQPLPSDVADALPYISAPVAESAESSGSRSSCPVERREMISIRFF